MRLIEGILITNTEGEYMAVATGEAAMRFNGIIRLNAASAFLVERMQSEVTEKELVHKLMEHYEVTEKRARTDVHILVEEFKERGLVIANAGK